MGRRSRAWRWIAGVAMAAAALILAGFIVIQTAWFHDWLRRAIVDRSRSLVDGDLAIGSITGDLLRGMTLHDVILRQDGRTIAAIPSVSIEYDLVGLLRSRYALRRLDLDRPVIQFDPAVDRSPLAPNGSETTAQTIAIAHFSVGGGGVAVGARTRPAWQFSSIAIHGSAAFGAATTLDIADLTAHDDRTGIDVRQFTMAATLSQSKTSIEQFHAATASSDIEGRGAWDAKDQTLDVDVHAHALSARELAAYISIPVDPALTPQLDAHASGSFRALHVTSSMSSSAGHATMDAVMNLAGASKTANGTVAVTRLNPAAFTGRRDWSGAVTARAALDATIPGA